MDNDISTMASEASPEDASSAPRDTHRYAVISCGEEWRVLSRRGRMGRFQSRAEALAVAVGLARQALTAGHRAEVFAHEEANDVHLYPLCTPLLDIRPTNSR